MIPSSMQPRILIVRLSHIGDCVLTMPLLTALRQALPQAHISWAVESPSHHLLEGHRALDKVIRVPKGWLKRPSTILAMRRELRAGRFDLVFDPQALTKSAMLAWISGAKRRIGPAAPVAKELAPWLYSESVRTEEEHIVPRSLELLRVLGVRRPNVDFQVPLRAAAIDAMSQFVHRNRLADGFVVINPGASWPSKRWELDRFASVASRLHAERQLRSVIVWAGDEERRAAERVVELSRSAALLAPATTLPELAALASLGSLFISSDSGPLHLAAAVGSPVVGLYGATRPEACGAWGPAARNLQVAYHSGSARERRSADNTAMRSITVEQVVEASEELLARTLSRSGAA